MQDYKKFETMIKAKEQKIYESIKNENLENTLHTLTKNGIINLCKTLAEFTIMLDCFYKIKSDKTFMNDNKQTSNLLNKTISFYEDTSFALEQILNKINLI